MTSTAFRIVAAVAVATAAELALAGSAVGVAAAAAVGCAAAVVAFGTIGVRTARAPAATAHFGGGLHSTAAAAARVAARRPTDYRETCTRTQREGKGSHKSNRDARTKNVRLALSLTCWQFQCLPSHSNILSVEELA